MEQLKEAYKSNLRQYVNHTTVQANGQISKITVNLLNKSGFYEQVEAALRKIFNICRYMVPYNLLLTFGFLLYKMRTNEIEQYFIVDHLQRDLERRSLINQVPNIWRIHTLADEDQVITDIRQTDFFDLLRDHMESEQYNFKILRMMHMTAEIFTTIDCNIHNNVVSSQQQQQYIGRGVCGDESSSDDDDYDDEVTVRRASNPFILDEADVSRDDDEEEQSDGGGGDSTAASSQQQQKLIRQYVQSQCRSRKSPVLISLKNLLMSRNHSRPCGSSSQAYYRKLCFFAQVARWRLLLSAGGDCASPVSDVDIRETTEQYYELYKTTYNITSDEMFEGVHISILHFLEYIFKLRINFYEIHSLKKAPPPSTALMQ